MGLALQRHILSLMLLLTFAVPQAHAISLFKCQTLLSKQKKQFDRLVSKTKLERLVEHKLSEAGLHPIDHRKDSLAVSRRAHRLAKKIDVYQLQNENYRQSIVEKIIDLKISENLNPLEDYELSLSESKREALTRIILRTLIQEGISELPEQDTTPGLRARFMKKIRAITNSRLYKMIVWWEVPTRKYTLNDYQLAWLVNEGVNGLLKLKDVQNMINKESRNEKIRGANTLFTRAFTAYFLFNFLFIQYPDMQAKYEAELQRQAQINTEEFIEDVQLSTQFDAGEILMDSARSEIEAIEADFIARYNEQPSAEEAKEIRQYICTVRYSDILNESQQQACLN